MRGVGQKRVPNALQCIDHLLVVLVDAQHDAQVSGTAGAIVDTIVQRVTRYCAISVELPSSETSIQPRKPDSGSAMWTPGTQFRIS